MEFKEGMAFVIRNYGTVVIIDRIDNDVMIHATLYDKGERPLEWVYVRPGVEKLLNDKVWSRGLIKCDECYREHELSIPVCECGNRTFNVTAIL